MMTHKFYNSLEDKELKDCFLQLQEGNEMTAFQNYEWMKTIDRSFRKNKLRSLFGQIRYLTIFDDSKAAMILPLHVQTHSLQLGKYGYKKGVYLLGQRSYSDYITPLYLSINHELLRYAISVTCNHLKQNTIYFGQLREDTTIRQIFLSQNNIYQVIEKGCEHCVALKLPATHEDFLRGISKNMMSNLKKQRNRQQRENIKFSYELIEGICANEHIQQQVNKIHSVRFKDKNHGNMQIFLGKCLNAVYGGIDEIQHAMVHNPASWLLLGKHNGEIISYMYGLKDKHAVRIMQLGFATAYKRYAPGISVFLEYIKDNYSSLNGHVIDFTRGEERYKYELGGKQHKIYDYSITYMEENK